MAPPKLLVVLPCYQEEEVLGLTYQTLSDFFEQLRRKQMIDPASQFCFVNDGSRDRTWSIISEICAKDPHAMGLNLSRNFGHQGAVLAGIFHHADAFDCFISIDADLQDDVNAMEEMLRLYAEGNLVVYGVRDDRTSDTWFKKWTAERFYKIMQWMGVKTIFNHADFRLMDRRVVREFRDNFQEVNLFLRGIVPLIGFKSERVFYKRMERQAGESKYPLRKMMTFAWNGITAFSPFPMRMVLYFGIGSFLVAICVMIYALWSWISGKSVSGWTSTLILITFFSAANMIAIGLIGEYIGKIYEEVKHRPKFIVDEVLNGVGK
jgi:polyisoprenyl-phosphate glycosyltransferase